MKFKLVYQLILLLAVNCASAQCVSLNVDTITTVAQLDSITKSLSGQKMKHSLEVYYRNASVPTSSNDLLACGCLTLVFVDSLKQIIEMPTGKWYFFDSLGRVKCTGQFDTSSSRFLTTQFIVEDTARNVRMMVVKFLHFIKLAGLWHVYKSPVQLRPNFYLFDGSYSKYIEFSLRSKNFAFDY